MSKTELRDELCAQSRNDYSRQPRRKEGEIRGFSHASAHIYDSIRIAVRRTGGVKEPWNMPHPFLQFRVRRLHCTITFHRSSVAQKRHCAVPTVVGKEIADIAPRLTRT